MVEYTSPVYADQQLNGSIISKTDQNLRQLIMVDCGQLINRTDI